MNLTLSLLLPMAVGAEPCAAGCKAPPIPPRFVAGMPYPPPDTAAGPDCPPVGPPAPVLAGRVIAPEGVRVTLLPGTAAARVYKAPVVAGFRPGYAYTLELANLPNHPGEALYPVLEVRGSLVPRAKLNYMDFPAPIYITRDDIEKAIGGALVTKYVYLEDPSKAVPTDTRADIPIEFTELSDSDAAKAAADNGRLVAVLRFGDRRPEPEDLARGAVPGTVLLPGEQRLAAPPVPPVFNWCGIPLYDPIAGPKVPAEECFPDGGDTGPRLGIGPAGRLGGLNPTDVALEYTVGNRRRVVTSNRVCVCSPRYAIRRVDVAPGGIRARAGLDALSQATGGAMAYTRLPVQALMNRAKPVGFVTRLRSAIIVSTEGVHSFIAVSAPQVVAQTVEGPQIVAVVIQPEEITSAPTELVVTKTVEPDRAVQPGEEVTFTIRFRNGTRLPVSDLMLSDSLSGRLEYVPGSAQSDRPANVTTAPNEAGSAVVRFEIPGPVPPGQGGVVKFRARVR